MAQEFFDWEERGSILEQGGREAMPQRGNRHRGGNPGPLDGLVKGKPDPRRRNRAAQAVAREQPSAGMMRVYMAK